MLPCFGEDKEEENRCNQEDREGQWDHKGEVDGIACGKSLCLSATITGLRMLRVNASSLSMAKPSAYESTWPLKICRATSWPQSRKRSCISRILIAFTAMEMCSPRSRKR